MPPWLPVILASFACSALTAWIIMRVRFERFEAMDKEREKHWTEWRRAIDEWKNKVENRPVNGYATLVHRVERIDSEIGTHSTGMRGAIHALEGKVESIQTWLLKDRGIKS